jgi:hypothetical protein
MTEEVRKPGCGDEVVVAAGAPPRFRPGARAWVVGVRTLGGEHLVIIEFEDGTSVEVPAAVIEAARS